MYEQNVSRFMNSRGFRRLLLAALAVVIMASNTVAARGGMTFQSSAAVAQAAQHQVVQ